MWFREEEAVNEAELAPEEFQVRKERMKAMREQVQLFLHAKERIRSGMSMLM